MKEVQIDTNNIEQIDKILEAATKVFNPSQEELEKYHKKEVWLKKVSDGGLLVSITLDNMIVAFAICEKRNNKLHIWNVGVLSDYRKLGLWKQMHDLIIKHAKQEGFEKITLNTYKEKFPNMYTFVSEHGYKEISKEFDEMQNATKSHFELIL